MKQDRMKQDRMKQDRMKQDRMKQDRMKQDRMKAAFLLLLCVMLSMPVHPALAAQHGVQPLPPAGGSLCGIKIGMDKDDARALLRAEGAVSADKRTVQDKDTNDKQDADDKKGADTDDALPEVWTLKTSPYEKIAFAADANDKVLWVTGFARPAQGVPFAQLGNLAHAAASGPTFAVWNVISPAGSYREIARGQGGKAMIVSLLPLKSADPNGAFSPQIIPKNLLKAQTERPKSEESRK